MTDATTDELVERVVDMVAETPEGARSRDLADALATDVALVRDVLVELERLGILYRTGQTRGTRWWLG